MLHAITIALSAFLLFLVQPIIAKQILPWFGGSAGVWTTCLVFFQVVLLGGYAYSDWLARRPARSQARVHVALLVVSLAMLPLAPSAAFKLHDPQRPIGAILALLATTLGLPFFALATTGPLLQAWWARRSGSARVYRLYALSNAASLTALLAYPLVVEPLSTVRFQSLAWSAGYVAFAACAAACAWRAARAPGGAPAAGVQASPAAAPSVRQQALWFALASIPSVLLVAVTAHLTQDVASIPFLWVLPLALYLVTFVLCFDSPRSYRPVLYGTAAAVLAVAMLVLQVVPSVNVVFALPLFAGGLFVLCMFCHGELAARKPAAAHLTRFYLMLSAGGAAGGLFVGVVAPLVFPVKLELSIALCATALLLYLLVPGRRRFVGAVALALSCTAFTLQVKNQGTSAIALSRNFYGTLRVRHLPAGPNGRERVQLVHGVILHGEQLVEPALRRQPTSYFGQGSGIDHAFRVLRPGPIHAGIVGMGAGTISAYGQAGDVFRYYELDPAVVEHARRYFTFLGDSLARTEVVVGDGRLGLERDTGQRFDLLVVDAFSSDSIPAHLLTREAVAVYRERLREGGLLAFHISNRHLELAPVVAGVAEANGLRAWLVEHDPGPDTGRTRSRWVLATASDDLAARLTAGPPARRAHPKEARPWSDDHTNLLGALRLFQGARVPGASVARADPGDPR